MKSVLLLKQCSPFDEPNLRFVFKTPLTVSIEAGGNIMIQRQILIPRGDRPSQDIPGMLGTAFLN